MKDSPIDQPPNIVPELLILALLPMQPVVHDPNMPNLIGDEDDNETIANVFCFGTFVDKHSGVVQKSYQCIPIHVVRWMCVFFCTAPLQIEHHPGHPDLWNG
jgi:hypothetical protein